MNDNLFDENVEKNIQNLVVESFNALKQKEIKINEYSSRKEIIEENHNSNLFKPERKTYRNPIPLPPSKKYQSASKELPIFEK